MSLRTIVSGHSSGRSATIPGAKRIVPAEVLLFFRRGGYFCPRFSFKAKVVVAVAAVAVAVVAVAVAVAVVVVSSEATTRPAYPVVVITQGSPLLVLQFFDEELPTCCFQAIPHVC